MSKVCVSGRAAGKNLGFLLLLLNRIKRETIKVVKDGGSQVCKTILLLS